MTNSPIDDQTAALYAELKRLAVSKIRRESSVNTLSATGLVHEAYLKLAQSNPKWSSREHFLGLAANAMRQILISHARARNADKRGGDWLRLTLTSAGSEIDVPAEDTEASEVLALDEALKELEQRDPRQARIVELRYFAGLSIEETAEAIGLSVATVKREWVIAKLFLKRKLAA